jgi:hypothetical protein
VARIARPDELARAAVVTARPSFIRERSTSDKIRVLLDEGFRKCVIRRTLGCSFQHVNSAILRRDEIEGRRVRQGRHGRASTATRTPARPPTPSESLVVMVMAAIPRAIPRHDREDIGQEMILAILEGQPREWVLTHLAIFKQRVRRATTIRGAISLFQPLGDRLRVIDTIAA